MPDHDSRVIGPAEIGQETRTLAKLAYEVIRLDSKADAIDKLLERAARLERRLIRYAESTGAPLKELRSWLSGLHRELALHRNSCRA